MGVAAEAVDNVGVVDEVGERRRGEERFGHLHSGSEAHGVGVAETAEVDERRRGRVVGGTFARPHGAATLVAEQADEQRRAARKGRTEMVHRHELDHAASQHRSRHQSVTVAGPSWTVTSMTRPT